MDNHDIFINVINVLEQKSHCVSKKVAAIAVKNGTIICSGINGTYPGTTNCDSVFLNFKKEDRETHHAWSLIYEQHAEANVVAKCAKLGISLDGAILYISMTPCVSCMNLLLSSGIKKIIYKQKYDKASEESLLYAKKCGIDLIKYEEK